MYHQRAKGGRGGRFDSCRGGRAVVDGDDNGVRHSSNGVVHKHSSSHANGGNYVWIRTDLVEAINKNGGSLPRNWKPSTSSSTSTTPPTAISRKRGRKDSINGQSSTWGWMRAHILQQSSSTSTTGQQQLSTSQYQSRIGGGGGGNTIASITVDDDAFAPIHLNHTTVSISYNSKDTELVCNANTWWQQQTPVPPNDLTFLTHLHEPAVVYCLRERYIRDEIYTYTGKILLALNPFRILPNVYGDQIMQQYLHSSPCDDNNKRPPPHVYAIAQEAYQAMIQNGTNQSILVSGESGAGKTVTTKITMGYLAMQSKRNSVTTTTSTAATTTTMATSVSPGSPPRSTSQAAAQKSSPSRLGRARGYASSRNSADGSTSNDSSSSSPPRQQQQQQKGIESQILQSNPILESFGNARTVRNDNSSRFGKFMELLFTPTGTLLSATIETYLLEKVRLITQASGERNYHIFYELLAGLPQRERQPLKIANTNALHFRMTASSGTFDRRDGVEDRDTYKDLRTALDTIGFTREEQHDIFAVACAVLHTSNIDFRQPTNGKAGEEGSELVSSTSLKCALHLLGVPMEALNNALCLCAIEARGEVFYKNMSVPQATKATEALIKATYAALFNYIVYRVNNSISFVEQRRTGSSIDDVGDNNVSTSPDQLKRIGVLDIFGFESFQLNSFEQLCINYCNEALQQQFNRFVFKLEQEEYEREGIEWSFIQFPDNQDVLDLIEKRKVGILSVLDEQCRLQTCTDASFCRAVYSKFTDNPRFSATNTQKANLEFSIHHYAGIVTYNSTNFLEKNKDELPKETTELLMSSSVPFLAYLGDFSTQDFSTSSTTSGERPQSPTSSVSSYYSFNSYRQSSATQASEMSISSSAMDKTNKQLQRKSSSILQNSVGNQFCHQLRELRLRIDSTTPHYVRCLKPNDELVPDQFEPHIIADQLRCSGVLEAIRVSRVGFPYRFVHADFLQRYSVLEESSTGSKSYITKKDQCADLIRKISPRISSVLKKQGDDAEKISDVHRIVSLGMQIGRNKVFLRRRVYEALEYSRNEKLGVSAIVIQKHTRRFLAQIRYYDAYMAIIMLQCFGRRVIASRKLSILVQHNAAKKIQCAWRRFVAETTLMAARLIAHFCQAYRRGDIARKLFLILRVEKQATSIQTCWRRHAARDRYWRGQVAAVTIQCFWRQTAATRLLKQLRLDARDLGVVVAERDHYKEESLRLRKEVEVLRQSRKFGGTNPANNEVDELRNEVLRLQLALSEAQKDSNSASRDLDQTAITEDSSFGGFRENIFAENDLLDSPSQQSLRTAHFPSTSFHPGDFSPSRPSPPTSLLDASYADGHGEIVDFSHEVGSDLRHNSSGIRNPSNPNDDASHYTMEPPPLTERRGAEFTVNLQHLHDSIRNNDYGALNRILNSSEDLHLLINEADEAGRTALHVAVSFGDLKTARMLLERGAIANAQDYAGDTPLHLAETASMTKLLLETGNANPNIPNLDGICVLHLAVQRRDAGSVQMLLKFNAKVDPADNARWFTPLHLACLPDRQGLEYQGPILRARAIIVDLLCAGTESSKADLDYQDSEGNTPLHYAVQIESSEACNIIITLLQKGSKTSISNSRNQQPLLLLCHNNNLRKESAYQECLDSMLYHGSDPNVQSNTGCTALHLSIYHQDIDSAVQLVSHAVELHLLWRKPKRWVAYWNDNDVSEVLALDMIQDEHSLHRLLAAITRPSKLAPIRTWCMNCRESLGSVPRALHCHHCSRHVCGACCRTTLPPHYFPKSFEAFEASWVCVICEKILVTRKEDASSGNTHPLSSTDDNYEESYHL